MTESPTLLHARETIAARLRELRSRSGLTQEEAARKVGIGWRHYQKIEAAEVNLSLTTLCRLAEVFAVGPDSLLDPSQLRGDDATPR